MKKIVLVTLATFLLSSSIFLFVGSKSVKTQEVYVAQEEYVPNEVLVKFKKDVNKYFIQDAINSVQGKIITYLGKEISLFQWDPNLSPLRSFRLDADLFHIKVPETIGTEKAIDILGKNPNVMYAEKNVIFHAESIPNDTHFGKLWGLHNTGQEGGKVDADIDAPEAWNIFTGSSNIVVAVIDTGVDYNHVDLAANIWVNPGESGNGKETNGVDDDNNGYIDDWHGWDFIGSPVGSPPIYMPDNDPMDENWHGDIYHGTHVAGTIGAVGNNGEGVTGVNWNVKIMAVRFLDEYGGGTATNAVHAIDYSTENGAHVSNNSWGGYGYSQPVYDAITRAMNAGKLFIAAAGNDAKNTDIEKHYPSCYPHANIISVAATSNKDELSIRSNYGASTVDLGAPGGWWVTSGETPDANDIYSTKRYNQYRYLCGTSMATPHVSGVAALVWGYIPSLSWSQVKNRIMKTVDPLIGQLCYKTVTGGRLNAYNALTEISAPAAPSNLGAVGNCWDVELTWQDNSDNENGFYIYRKTGDQYVQFDYVGPNVTTYLDMDLWCGQLWCYKVSAFNQYGVSCLTLSKCAKTLPCYLCEDGFSLKLSADKEIIASGEAVTYTYKVENKAKVDLSDIQIVDDKLGIIASKITLQKGETIIFTKTVILNETATNCAEASAAYHYENKIEKVKSRSCAKVEVRFEGKVN